MKRTPLHKNSYFKWGVALLIAVFLLLYFVVDRVVMPSITRQNDIISVPDFTGKTVAEALAEIESSDLVLGDTTSRTGPNQRHGLIASQTPRPNASVKSGRRVYLSIYRRSNPYVVVPDVIEESLRNAKLRLEASGLVVHHEEPDTIPSPVIGTVTRIFPAVGDSVLKGDSVTVWYGRGVDEDRLVLVPNVVGRRYLVAETILRDLSFWPTLLDQIEDDANPLILRQSPEPGKRLPAGSTLRLFATDASLEEE